MAITPQKHSNHIKDPNHACLQPTSINITLPHKNGSIKMKLMEGVGNLRSLLTVYFCTPSMFITLWFGFDYGTNPPLGTLII
jgi:hypothetical protein